jgi:hypothetical protein
MDIIYKEMKSEALHTLAWGGTSTLYQLTTPPLNDFVYLSISMFLSALTKVMPGQVYRV